MYLVQQPMSIDRSLLPFFDKERLLSIHYHYK